MRTHFRPLRAQNGIVHRVSHPARGCNHVAAENALLHGAQAAYGIAGLLIQSIGFELDTVHAQSLEGMPQEEQLGFRIDCRTLMSWCDPRPANLEPAVLEDDIGEARAADRLTVCSKHDGERQRRSSLLIFQCGLHIRTHFLLSVDGNRDPLPESRFQSHPSQAGHVLKRQRLEADGMTRERDWCDIHLVHWRSAMGAKGGWAIRR